MKKKNMLTRLAASALAVSVLGSTMFTGTGTLNVNAADTEDPNWEVIKSVVSRYSGEWTDTTYTGAISNKIPTTALLGNGDVGITSAGDELSKTFYISKGDFWAYNGTPMLIGGVTIEEQEEEGTADTAVNLAPLYKTVTASSYHDNFKPENAVDGNMEQDPSGSGWVSSLPKDQPNGEQNFWLQLEFNEPITIGRYVVKNDGATRPGVDENNTKDFELQMKATGTEEEWTPVDTVTGNTESIYDKNLETPVQAKMIRLYITAGNQGNTDDSKQNPRARIGQFELYEEAKEAGSEEPEAESSNLALKKPVKVCQELTDGVTHAGSNLVDGVESTKWCSLHDDETEHWAIVDLGEKKNIGYYELIHSGIVGEVDHNTVGYKLQYLESDNEDWNTIENIDNSMWKDMDEVNDNKETITSKAFEAPFTARYVRLLITKPASGNNAARVHELVLQEEAPKVAPFYEKQDILNAEIQTEQELVGVPTEMKTWLAADENVMVTELTSKGAEDVNLQVETWASDNKRNIRPITAANDESSVTVTRTTENNNPENPNSHVSQAAVSTKIIGADGVTVVSDNNSGKGNLKFTLKAGETVYVVTAVGGGGRTYKNDGVTLWDGAKEPTAEAAELLNGVADANAVAELSDARLQWWKDFWSASYIDFGTEDENLNKVQKYYYGAQYILGSGAREGELAPGLYGIWHTNDDAMWHSDYHLNYNFMATFYGTYSSNRPEIAKAGIQALYDYVEEGQRRATSTEQLERIDDLHGNDLGFVKQKIEDGVIDPVNGIEGAILFPVGIGPWGTTTDDLYLNEALDAAYNDYLMTQYYDYTSDEEMLKDAYNYMKQAAAFYEAWLEKEETEDGGYEYVLYVGFNEGSWSKNPAVELSALKNTLRHLITYSEKLGVDEDKRAEWKDIYEHLGDQATVNYNGKEVLALAEKEFKDGEWKELTSPIPWDGNALPLDSMIPGGVYTHFSSPEDLQLVQDTIDVFSENGAWAQINNFPRLFPEAVKARYDVHTVVTKLVDVIDSQMGTNMQIQDGYHGIEKSGSTETINSMMLISDDGLTKIFPNWYTDKDAKFANLRAKGAFTVSAEYDGATQEAKNVTITSEAGEEMTLVSPWAEGMTVKDSQGNVVATTKGSVPNWETEENATYTFATTAGETYTVEKGETEAPVEKADIVSVSGMKDMTVNFGTAFKDLKLPETVTVTLSDGTTAEAAVEWSEEGYVADKAGTYTLTGTLVESDGYTNTQDLKASINVIVKEKDTTDDGNKPDDGNNGNTGDNGNNGNGNNGNNGNGNKPNDGNKPSNGNGPKTGDSVSLFIWMAVAVIAAGTTATAVAVKSRKNRRNKR